RRPHPAVAGSGEVSRSVGNVLGVVGPRQDVQGNLVAAQTELRGYILTGERDRLAQAGEFVGRAGLPVQALRARPAVIADQRARIDALDALIVEEFNRFEKLIGIDRRKGLLAAIRSITATGGAAAMRQAEAVTADLLAVEALRLAAQTEQSRRSSDLSIITAAVATFFNLALLAIVILLARREIRERRQAEEVVKFAATHDPLTGLPNR